MSEWILDCVQRVAEKKIIVTIHVLKILDVITTAAILI